MAMQIKRLPFGAWEPDAVRLDGEQSCEALNVIPIKRGYRPFSSLVSGKHPPLPNNATCLLAYCLKHTDGSVYTLVASSDNKLYSLETINNVPAWVQKYTGVPATEARAFTEYGTTIYALFGSKLLKASISGTIGTFTDVSYTSSGVTYTPPNAEVMGVIKDFLWLGRISGNPTQVHWSALDNPDFFPTVGSDLAQAKQSDVQTFPQGGKIQAIIGAVGAADGLVFTERAVHLASYIGTPYIFSFKEIDHTSGLLAPKSPVITGPMCVYLSNEGWMITDGATTKALGIERVDRWFFDKASATRVPETIGCHDPENRLCFWVFASNDCPANMFDNVLIYNYALDKWSHADCNVECLFSDFIRGMTLEDLDSYGVSSGSTSQIDTLGISLDSPLFRTGRSVLGGFYRDGNQSRIGQFAGLPMEATIETIETGGKRLMIHGIRPLVDSGEAKALPMVRDREAQQRRDGISEYREQSRDGVCYSHVSTSYGSARVNIPSGETWRDAFGVELLYEEEGGL